MYHTSCPLLVMFLFVVLLASLLLIFSIHIMQYSMLGVFYGEGGYIPLVILWSRGNWVSVEGLGGKILETYDQHLL